MTQKYGTEQTVHRCREIPRRVLALACLLGGALLGAAPAQAAVTEFVAGMQASGTPTYSGTCTVNGTSYTPGQDACGEDNVVRTHDYVTYRVGYTVTPQDTNALLVLEVGATTLPTSTYTGPANPRIAYFDRLDLPTGSNGCLNISTTPVADPPAVGVSGVTANGQKLFCYQPTPASGNNQNFRVRIAGSAPNGTLMEAPTVTFSSANNSATSTPNELSGGVGAETFYGLDPVVVSAAPRWDAVKTNVIRSGVFVPASGPAGQDGYVFSWNIGIKANGSRKGLEALATAGWLEDYSDADPVDTGGNGFNDSTGANDFPNARLVTWPMNNSFISTNITGNATGNGNPRNCGDWRNQHGVLGNTFDNVFYYPQDNGTVTSSTATAVARGGECVMTPGSDNLAAKTAQFELIGTDFSLTHYPTRKGSNPAATVLVQPNNLDAESNEFWVASKTILVWAPVTDIVFPDGVSDLTEFLTNRVTFSGTSVTGQANVDPVATNDAWVSGARRVTGDSFSKSHVPWHFYNNPQGWDVADIRDPNVTGDGHVNQLAPNQYFHSRIISANSGTNAFGAGYVCDKLDNTRLSFVDLTASQFTIGDSRYIKDPDTGIFVFFFAGDASFFDYNIQLGVGGTGIVNAASAGGSATTGSGTWESTTTAVTEYTAANNATGTMATSGCATADATWFDSVGDLLAAGYTTQDVSRVRMTYDDMPAAVNVSFYIPQKVNAETVWATQMSAAGAAYAAPGTTVAANESSVGMLSTNQALWHIRDDRDAKAPNSLLIFQNEYAQITKSSPTHANNSLVTPGSQVTYNLQVNLSTSGSAHPTDVAVYDVLPEYMSYEAGSSTFGGVAQADPSCVAGPAPWPTGWGSPTAASDAIPAGYTACRWALPGQTAIKALQGAATANLPLLQFRASLGANVPNGQQILNTSFADSTNNFLRDARYAGGTSPSFACVTGQPCSFSNWLLSVDAAPGAIVSKTVSASVVPTVTGFSYGIEYGAIGNALSDFRIIDVLPFNGDAVRTPLTNYAGTLGLSGPVTPQAVSLEAGVANDDDVLIYYTNNVHAQIIQDPFAAGAHDLTGASTNSATVTNWCTGVGGANCPADWDVVTGIYIRAKGGLADIEPGERFRLTVNMLPDDNLISNVYTNSFIADSPSLSARRPGSNIVTTRVVGPDLVISKTASPTQQTAGGTVNYEIIVRNDNVHADAGPFMSGAITVTDPMPAGLLATLPITATGWDCADSTTTHLSCNYIGTYPIPIGATLGGPINVTATIPSPLGALTRGYTNTAEVETPTTEISTTNNDDDAVVTALATPEIGAYKRLVDGPTANGDGTWNATFEVGARNYGPQNVTGFNLTDSLIGAAPAFGSYVAGTPTAIGTYTVVGGVTSCTRVSGAAVAGATYVANASFTGDAVTNTFDVNTVLPGATESAPGEVNCQFTVRFAPAADQTHFENSVTASGSADGVSLTDVSYNGTDPKGGDSTGGPTVPANNVPTPLDIDRVVQPSVTKEVDLTRYILGDVTNVVYTITAGNTGPDGLAGFTVVDTPAAGITIGDWTCAITNAGTAYVGITTACGSTLGSGALNTTVDLQPGAVITYTVNAVIDASVTGAVTNTAAVSTPPTLPPGFSCASNCTVEDDSTLTDEPRQVQPTISKEVNTASYQPQLSTTVEYSIVVGNTGPHGGNGFVVTDTPPVGVTIDSWSCAVTTVGTAYPGVTTACAAPAGTAGPLNTTVDLQPGAQVTYTLEATIAADAAGSLTNTATATAPPGSECASACTVTDDVTVPPLPFGMLSVLKSVDKTNYVYKAASETVQYTIVVTNHATGPVVNAAVVDAQPTGVTFDSWTCQVTNPGTNAGFTNACAASGSGDINDTVTLNPGAELTYVVEATIAATVREPVENTVTVTVPPDQCTTACTAESTVVTKGTPDTTPVPAGGLLPWLFMMLSLVAGGALMMRRHQRAH